MTSPSSSFARLVNLLYVCTELAIFLELSSEIFHALSHYCKAIKSNSMLYLLLLASLLHVPALGVLGETCGETVQTHTLTQKSTQTNPTNGNVTQTYQLTWTSMVIHINILTMAAPREDPHRDPEEDPPRDPRGDPPGRPVPAPRAIQLTVKYPSFNWEGNTHEQFKTFKQRTEILMEGPYEDYKEPDKVAAILGWLGDKGHQVYASLDWTALGKDKKKYQDVLDAFDSYFKPMQTIMHSWYQLGNIYSSQCKDQTEFMTRLKELSKETGFKEPDELTKFLFVIHNTDSKMLNSHIVAVNIIVQTLLRDLFRLSRDL